MVHTLVDIGMSLATLCFVLGYWKRKQTKIHRIWMGLGVLLVLMTAIMMLVAIYVFYDGDRLAAGFRDFAPVWIILAHRLLASIALILMLAMVATGIARQREWHVRLHRLFIPVFAIVYISGLLIFRNF